MEFYEVIEKRRTIRDFESEDIPKEIGISLLLKIVRLPRDYLT